MWYQNILETLGNTPMVRLNNVTQGLKCTVLAKVEYFNPGNSVKDRIAVEMINEAERTGKLKPGGTIIEGTSGNTGFGLALVAVVRGYRCICTITDKQSQEKIDILRSLGAEVIVCPTNVEPEDPQSYYSVAKRLATEIPNSFYPNQYDNLANRQAHYRHTGPEIWEQTEGKITHFVAGMGTCGTITGTSQFLKEKNPNLVTIGVDTYGSLFQKLHETGEIDMNEVYPYATEGIGEDFVPQNLDLKVVDKIIKVTDKDAAVMTRKLARLEGLFVGWSCGSAAHAALEYARSLGPKDMMVVILPDHGTRYLAKVYNDQWMKDRGYLDAGALVTAQEILNRKQPGTSSLLQLDANELVARAIELMRQHDISQVPVYQSGEIVGSLSESAVLNRLLDDPSVKEARVGDIMADPFPFVLPTTRIDVISKMISKEVPAVIVQKADGSQDIITKSDLISVLAG
jgi:cystathionine beta-synthase